MGGASPKTVDFRGADVDPVTADALTELAAISGSIYVEPIRGYGSYRNNTASGGTDTGGGHCDLNLEGRTDADARKLETLARSLGFVAYFRPRTSPYSGRSYGWQRHLHLIRRDCTDLSAAARTQVRQYDQGLDGLAVPHKDTGSRAYVGVTWGKYLAAKKATASKPPTPAPVPAPKPPEDDMPTPDEIYAAVWKRDVFPAPVVQSGNPTWTPENVLGYVYKMVDQRTAALSVQVAGLAAAVQALAGSKGANGDAVVEAVRSEVAKAMQGLEVTLTVPPAGA